MTTTEITEEREQPEALATTDTDLAAPDADEQPHGSLANFATDPNAETNGIWFKDPATGVELRIAHGENRNYRDYLQTLIRPYLSLINSNTPRGYAFMRKMEAKAMAKHVLLGWRGLTDENGKPIEYSHEKALELLIEPKWRKFRRIVDVFSSDENAFGPDREEWGED